MTSPSEPILNPRLVPPGGGILPWLYYQVHEERIRAHNKHGAKGNSREDAAWDDREWLPILMEELGEAAHEMTYDAELPLSGIRTRLREELIQVAAMACAWIAAIDATGSVSD